MTVYPSAAIKDLLSNEKMRCVRVCRCVFSWVCFYSMSSRGDMPIKYVDNKILGKTVSVSVLVVIQQASPRT